MPSVLHPCPTCRHSRMDECWAASKRLRTDQRHLCVDCHDECMPPPPPPPPPTEPARSGPKKVDPRLLFG